MSNDSVLALVEEMERRIAEAQASRNTERVPPNSYVGISVYEDDLAALCAAVREAREDTARLRIADAALQRLASQTRLNRALDAEGEILRRCHFAADRLTDVRAARTPGAPSR